MPDRSGHRVYLMYLPLLWDLEQAGEYSWGSAVLAFLYRELCNATHPSEQGIGGCLTLLHLWAWDRFPILAPQQPAPPSPQSEVYPLPPPLGFRWKQVGQPPRPRGISLQYYRRFFDVMTDDQIIWMPYDTPIVQQLIPEYCLVSPQIWRASVPLICFHIIEWHHPDRVLRQFGRQQPIPVAPVFLGDTHTIQLRGKTRANWMVEHMCFIQAWIGWRDSIADAPTVIDPLSRISEYMQWYWRHTRRWIHPDSAATGFAADIAEDLYKLNLHDPLQMPTREYQQRVLEDQHNILLALREQRFTTIPDPAPHPIELSRPEIPISDRPSKRRHGYLSTRPPFMPQYEQQQCYNTFSTAGSSSSSSHAPTTIQQLHSSWSNHSSPNSNQFGPFMSLFDNPTMFAAEYNAYTYTFEQGGSSHDVFVTPQQSIPPVQSPVFDLNNPQIEPTNELPESQQEEQGEQIRPRRLRRKPRCGTGSHYA